MSALFDAASAGGITTGTVVTVAHTCSGTNRLLLVCVQHWFSNAVTSCTYNGVAMTAAGDIGTGDSATAAFFKLVNPDAGTFNIVATMSNSNAAALGAQSFTAVNQSTPLGTIATAGGSSSSTPSVNVTSGGTDEVVADFVVLTGVATPTAGAGQTQRYNSAASNNQVFGSTEPGAAGTVTMDWSLSTAKFFAQYGVSIAAAAAAVESHPASNHIAFSKIRRWS